MPIVIDNERDYFKLARNNMVKNQILPLGISNQTLLNAFQNIPKQLFVSDAMEEASYTESAMETGHHRMILDTRVLSKMIDACKLSKSDTVLDIGCGFGYSSIVMSLLSGHVIGLENDLHFITKFKYIISKYNIKNCTAHLGSLSSGFPDAAPFDVIFVNGAFLNHPQELLDQLNKNGRCVLIERKESGLFKAVVYTKSSSALNKDEICIANPDNIF